MSQKPAVGFIGIGVMGKSMAGHIQQAGYPLHVYTRSREKAEQLVAGGAIWHATPDSLAKASQVVVTIVGYPKDVEQIYFGAGGLLTNAAPGSLLIDMTTSSPLLAERIAREAAANGLHALDAPVSGGDVGARAGKLSVMVGGDRAAFDRALPMLELMGSNVVHQGEAGAGQHAKLSNQIAIASNMMGVCEALMYAKAAGLQPEQVMKSIESGAAGSWSLSRLGPRMLQGDYAPGFYVKHFLKDMTIALESARDMKLDLPGLALAKQLYEKLVEWGEGDSGTQALFKYYLRAMV